MNNYRNNQIITMVFVLFSMTGALLLPYAVIGKNMPVALQIAVLVMIFFLCFFSVRISLVLLIVSMLLSPEIGMGSTSSREITLRLEDVLLFIMTLGWMFKIAIFKDIGFIIRSPLNKPIAAYSAIAILSTVLGALYGSVNILSGTFFVLKFIEYFFLYKVIVNYVHGERGVNNLLSVLLAVCGVVVLYGLFQALTGGDVAAPFEGSRGERNTLGGYLVLMGAVAAGVIMNTPNRAEKYLLSILLALLVAVLAFSLSRSGWVSSFVVTFVLLFYIKRKGVYIAIVSCILVLIPLVSPQHVEDRFAYTFEQNVRPGQQIEIGPIRLDTSTSARFYSAQLVFRKFLNHPLLGHGVTGFPFVDGQFFRILAEMGMLGLLAFLWLLFEIHKLLKNALQLELTGRLRGMIIGFYAGFWGLMAHAATANTFIIVRIAEPFWCLTGLVVVISLQKTPELQPVTNTGQNEGFSIQPAGAV